MILQDVRTNVQHARLVNISLLIEGSTFVPKNVFNYVVLGPLGIEWKTLENKVCEWRVKGRRTALDSVGGPPWDSLHATAIASSHSICLPHTAHLH